MGSKAKPRSRLRRILVGLTISAVTFAVLGLVLEITARLWFAKELLSFRPIYSVDQVAGYRFKPNLSEYALGAQVVTNSFGNRGSEWSRKKPNGVFRIALIGDSLAFGFGVEMPETVGEVLARRIKERTGVAAEVLNFAAPGYNSSQELAVLEKRALTFYPDLVLVLMTSNDHDKPLHVDAEGYLHWGDPRLATTKVGSEHVPKPGRWGLWRHSAMLTYAKFVWMSYRQQATTATKPAKHWMARLEPGPISPHVEKTVLQPLLAMAAQCKQRGVPLVVTCFAASTEHRQALRLFAEQTGCPTLELLSLFKDVTSADEWHEQYSLGWDSHPNPKAHARWAEGVLTLLDQQGLLTGR